MAKVTAEREGNPLVHGADLFSEDGGRQPGVGRSGRIRAGRRGTRCRGRRATGCWVSLRSSSFVMQHLPGARSKPRAC